MQISLPNFVFFTVKSPSVTKRSVSQEYAYKKSKTRRLFFAKLGLKFFYSNWKQFQVFKIVKFEFKVTRHYGLILPNKEKTQYVHILHFSTFWVIEQKAHIAWYFVK